MKIWTLIENTTADDALTPEHGLSLYIEFAGKKILFDAGESGVFADNAEKMGIDLSQVDLCVLSHGHYDHGGGLKRFLKINDKAPIYLRRDAFLPHYGREKNDIGLDPALQDCGRLVYVEEELSLGQGMTLYACNQRNRPFPTQSTDMYELRDGVMQVDRHLHEQYLLLEENGKKVLISGCSHKGILNIAHWFQPDVLIGGFHFMRVPVAEEAGKRVLEEAAQKLLEFPTVYHTGHCTGKAQFDFLKPLMGDRLFALGTGKVLEF